VVDRIVVRRTWQQRLADSFETALKLADGIAVAEFAETAESQGTANKPKKEPHRIVLREVRLPGLRLHHPEIEPRLFSFNNPFGACPACDGLGVKLQIDPICRARQRQVAARGRHRALGQGRTSPYYTQTLEALAQALQVLDRRRRGRTCRERRKNAILYGTGEDEIKFTYDDGRAPTRRRKPFEGVMPTSSAAGARPTAPGCARTGPLPVRRPARLPRLSPEARSAGGQDRGQHIGEVSEPVDPRGARLVRGAAGPADAKQNEIAARILKEIRERLRFLVDVGLDYLTLSRAPARCPAARASASAWPRRSAPA
jgi:excinuclease ABC subunit A